jgi:hypothetical protein
MGKRLAALLAALVLTLVLVATPSCKAATTSTSAEGGTPTTGTDSGVITAPTNIDCTKKENCYHLVCYDAPECADTPDPGACPVGQVKEIVSDGGDGTCRACTEADCDGLPGFCCGADVCKNHVECNLYICKNIEATCMGTTGTTCGFHDLDGDDAFGDCDEAPTDPCCFCKIAVGCADSLCPKGNKVVAGACSPCTANDCAHPTCMGLNGCATNCQADFYFDGVRCRDCASSGQAVNIPACNLDGGM